MKKSLLFIIVVITVLLFTMFSYAQDISSNDNLQNQINTLSTQVADLQNQVEFIKNNYQFISNERDTVLVTMTPQPTPILTPSSLSKQIIIDGQYEVLYKGFTSEVIWSSKRYIQIKLKFSNFSENGQSFNDKVWVKAYQNEILLEEYKSINSGEYDVVKPGEANEIAISFWLTEENCDVKIIIGQKNNKISEGDQVSAWVFKSKDIKKAMATKTPVPTKTKTKTPVPTSTPKPYKSLYLGDYKVDIVEILRYKKEQGNILEFNMVFYNNSSDSTSFESALDYTVFLNGIELEPTNKYWDESNKNLYTKIRPGAYLEVVRTFELPSISDGDIEIDIKPYFDRNKTHEYSGYLGSFGK